jgi:hypothetical protein
MSSNIPNNTNNNILIFKTKDNNGGFQFTYCDCDCGHDVYFKFNAVNLRDKVSLITKLVDYEAMASPKFSLNEPIQWYEFAGGDFIELHLDGDKITVVFRVNLPHGGDIRFKLPFKKCENAFKQALDWRRQFK